MHDQLQNEYQTEHEPQLTFMQKFQQKLAESRYFMLSCVLHTVIVIIGGTYVIYKAIEPPDFVAEAFCVSRLSDNNYLSFGTLPDGVETEKIIERSMVKIS